MQRETQCRYVKTKNVMPFLFLQGDSGGPLMCQRCASCAWYAAGITSFGPSNCAVAGKPGVYTKIGGFESWIRKTTGIDFGNSNFPTCT